MVLSKSHYPHGRLAVGAVGRGTTTNSPQQVSDLSGHALVQLALQTLARFNFKVDVISLSSVNPTCTCNLTESCITFRVMTFLSLQGNQ